MTEEEMEAIDALIPEIAVKALNAATQRALDEGHEIVVRVGDNLCRVKKGQEPIIIKPMEPRIKASELLKQRRS